jgi:hypothetical protein
MILTILLLPALAFAELTDFYLEVDPKDGTISDSYELSVVLEGPSADGSAAPQLKGGDFKATFVGPRTETMIVNGDVTRRMIFVYRIVPTKSGALTTPSASIEVDGSEYVANAVAVNVSRTPAKVSGVNFEQYVDNPEPYVGEQIVYSIEVATNASLYELRLDDTPFDGFWGEPFKDETRTSRQINGARYAVSGTKRSLYAMRDGVLPLPERTLRAKMRERSSAQSPFGPFNPFDDGFLNPLGSRMVERSFIADKTEVRVKPLPPIPAALNKENFRFGIVGATELSSNLSNTQNKVGEPITFEITLKSLGNLRHVQLDLNVDSGLKVYPEKPRVTTDLFEGKHVMEKVFAFSIVPKRAGTFTIPAISIGYFDPKEAKFKALSTDAAKFEVASNGENQTIEESHDPAARTDEEVRSAESIQDKSSPPPQLPSDARPTPNSTSLWWMGLFAGVGVFLGWFLRGRGKVRAKDIGAAKSLGELDELFVSELNQRLALNPPATKWGLRAALMRELKDRRPDAAKIIGVLDSLDNSLYGSDGHDLKALRAQAASALELLRSAKGLDKAVP